MDRPLLARVVIGVGLLLLLLALFADPLGLGRAPGVGCAGGRCLRSSRGTLVSLCVPCLFAHRPDRGNSYTRGNNP